MKILLPPSDDRPRKLVLDPFAHLEPWQRYIAEGPRPVVTDELGGLVVYEIWKCYRN